LATTWIKPTYAHKRYNSKTTVKRKINYILDKRKTALPENADEKGQEPEHENTDVDSSISEYIQNPGKTENNKLITGYECFPEYADEQFATSMELYERNTGRKHKDNSRLLYHMRQSFKPGEVDPVTANRIGYELALEYTGGKHAFVVATHTDKLHIHNHIIFNAFNLECNGKFKDSYFNYRDVAKISDRLCKEYELSVIEVKHGWRDPYNEWEKKQGITKEDKEPSKKEQLENVIAMCLEKRPKDFNHLLKHMEDYSCHAKKRGHNVSITAPFSKRPIRLISLSEEFTEEGIKKQIAEQQSENKENTKSIENISDTTTNEIINSARTDKPEAIKPENKFSKPKTAKPKTVNPISENMKSKSELRLIIDIQNSLKATESIGYKKWVEKFNLEQMSQTLLFIEKHQLSLNELENMAAEKPQTLINIKNEIEAADEKLQSISLLQRHIGAYGKTKEVYREYKRSKTPGQFRQDNAKAIADHEAARAYFDGNGYGFGSGNKLPSIKELREQYAVHNSNKKSLWAKYHEIKNTDKEIENAWANVKTLLKLKDEIILEEKPKPRNAPNL